MMNIFLRCAVVLLVFLLLSPGGQSFIAPVVTQYGSRRALSLTTCCFAVYSPSSNGRRKSRINGADTKSKRQYRVGQVVKTELAKIVHTGVIKGKDVTYLDADLRRRISIVNVDVSPDLKQARVSVSIRNAPRNNEDSSNIIVDKRQIYSWLVQNTKYIRHTLAQKMSHMKTSSPNLQFVQVDVSAAVDVMYLIDKVSKGYQRESVEGGIYNSDGTSFDPMKNVDLNNDLMNDEEFDGEWEEEDDEFFDSK